MRVDEYECIIVDAVPIDNIFGSASDSRPIGVNPVLLNNHWKLSMMILSLMVVDQWPRHCSFPIRSRSSYRLYASLFQRRLASHLDVNYCFL